MRSGEETTPLTLRGQVGESEGNGLQNEDQKTARPRPSPNSR